MEYELLNELRFEMGADKLGEFHVGSRGAALTREELVSLTTEGIDVTGDRIEFHDDGTLKYKGIRVLVYIRDVADYGRDDQSSRPRFHFASCRTLQQMKDNNRFHRYVVATRDDGFFQINVTGKPGRGAGTQERLNVCQNCLNRLSYKGFSYSLSEGEKSQHVRKFELKEFFATYPRDLLYERPTHSADTQPLNEYTSDWAIVSARFKADAGFMCQRCDLGPLDRHNLHVHHKNAAKYDNRPENLICLCIGCHSNEYSHSHIKATRAFKEFREKFPSWGGDQD
ncbi:MAG: HNH endonuclease [Alphaproteobacteria bacterium]|nr:HNH endonuclease [Alphaproteobacteria bacterium]